ncbi:MAG TPA: hypothetical protein VNL15_02805, partial [Dehalococcoidia bacterium]|nr:hypothetical protein [Dehalococcoidia bacterium]
MAVKLDAERRRLWLDIAQVWTGATLANILLYFFQIVVGRGLGPQDYSLFGALLGMVYLASAASNAINASVADVVARQKANGDADAGSAAGSALLQMMALGGVLFALTCLASPLLGAYVHSDSLTPVMLTNALLLTALIVPVTQGALLGEQRFGWYSAGQILSSSSRLLLGVGALALGLGISGVMGAAIVSVLATF